MADEIQRDLGAHGARLDRVEQDVSQILRKVDNIQRTLDETKGSLKMLFAVGGISGAIGAAAVKALAYLKGGG